MAMGKVKIMASERGQDIYGGQDPRDLSIYTATEAAKYLRIPVATLRSWVKGRQYPRGKSHAYFEPIIQRPDASSAQLSFNNLVEAHILRALRHKHQIKMENVRLALEYAQREYSITRLLLRSDLMRSNAGELFLERYGKLINRSRGGQLAMKAILENYLERVEWEKTNLPARLFPFSSERTDRKIIVIDPFISFGRPVINSRKISTSVIADRVDAGESVESVADDYGLEEPEIMEALVYEKAA